MSIMGNLIGSSGLCLVDRECSHCGDKYSLIVTKDEKRMMDNGVPVQEVFGSKAKLIQEQATLNLCDKCFTSYHQGRS